MNYSRNDKMNYAKAYIKPQKYDNIFSLDDGFKNGTMFKDLYCPYKSKKD